MGDYAEKIKNMTWSYSRLSLYEECKYCWYLKYIIADDKEYLPEGNYYAEVGTFMHEILAMTFEDKLTLNEAAQFFVDNYDDHVCYQTKETTMNKTFELCADYFATVDFDWLKDYEILGIEKEVRAKINGYNYFGIIDLLLQDKKTKELVIVDHKSGAYPLKKDGEVLSKEKIGFESRKKQMYLYCCAVKENFGQFPSVLKWNHFKYQKVASIPFNEEEYNNTINWFTDTIHQIENEKDFEPNIGFFYCFNLCDYRNSCEYNCCVDEDDEV